MELDLKRTRDKLKTMAETPFLYWILGDLIEVMAKDLGYDNMVDNTDQYKTQLVERLKNKYEDYIRDNEKPNGKQQLLGL